MPADSIRTVLVAVFMLLTAGTCRAADTPPADDPPPLRVEGAIGLLTSYGPAYDGADRSAWRWRPAGFLRIGRVTLSGAGGFTTRREDDVERGVAASLVERRSWRLSLAGRWTGGRQEGDADGLAGMGDIPGTVLARARLQWLPDGPWRYALGVNADVLGRGHGWMVDLGAARSWTLAPATRLQWSAGLSLADAEHMRTWYGVTADQALRSGYAVYRPGGGLRDLSSGLTLRHDLGPRWGSYAGIHASWQLGPAADSPLVRQRLGWSVGAGLVWRF